MSSGTSKRRRWVLAALVAAFLGVFPMSATGEGYDAYAPTDPKRARAEHRELAGRGSSASSRARNSAKRTVQMMTPGR